MSSRFLAALLAALLLHPGPSAAQSGLESRQVTKAQAQLEDGDFEGAVRTIDQAVADPTLTEDEQVELYRLLGLAQLYLGNEQRARQAYERLLQARPDYELPRSAPPKIRDLYARIKEDIKGRRLRPVVLAAEPPREVKAASPLEVEATIDNLAAGARAKLYFRRAGAQSYSSVDFVRAARDANRFRASVPAYELPAEGRAYALELYLEVADAAQRRLAGRGDPLNPLTVRIVDPSAPAVATVDQGSPGLRPWYLSPWVYVGAGFLLAGAATGAVLLASPAPTGELPVLVRVGP